MFTDFNTLIDETIRIQKENNRYGIIRSVYNKLPEKNFPGCAISCHMTDDDQHYLAFRHSYNSVYAIDSEPIGHSLLTRYFDLDKINIAQLSSLQYTFDSSISVKHFSERARELKK